MVQVFSVYKMLFQNDTGAFRQIICSSLTRARAHTYTKEMVKHMHDSSSTTPTEIQEFFYRLLLFYLILHHFQEKLKSVMAGTKVYFFRRGSRTKHMHDLHVTVVMVTVHHG